MPGELTNLFTGKATTTAPATQVFAATTKTLLKEIVVTNVGGGIGDLEVYILPATGTAVAIDYALFYKVPFNPRSVTSFQFNKVLPVNSVIRVQASVNDTLTLHISGVTNAP